MCSYHPDEREGRTVWHNAAPPPEFRRRERRYAWYRPKLSPGKKYREM
jgi:hypothetical protein